MTHKYLTQIRTVPNYHEDQSNFAKNWRKAKYSFKSTSNTLLKNKKTRIIISVLGIYTILTSGFVVSFVSTNNNQANAQSYTTPINNLDIKIRKQSVESQNIYLKLELQNTTNETIVSPSFQFQSSFDNIVWLASSSDENSSKSQAQNSSFKLSDVSPKEKITYTVYGQLKNLNVNNIAVATQVLYSTQGKSQVLESPKFLINLH